MLGHEDCFGCGNKCHRKFFGGYSDRKCEVMGMALLITLDISFHLLYAPCESIFEAHI